jgi:hypothetical protein
LYGKEIDKCFFNVDSRCHALVLHVGAHCGKLRAQNIEPTVTKMIASESARLRL